MTSPRFFIRLGQWGVSTDIRFGYDNGESITVAEPVTMKQIKKSDVTTEVPAMLSFGSYGSEGQDALQSLMDELWNLGIRPRDIGGAGHLAATQEHLKDMRAIVSKQLDVKL